MVEHHALHMHEWGVGGIFSGDNAARLDALVGGHRIQNILWMRAPALQGAAALAAVEAALALRVREVGDQSRRSLGSRIFGTVCAFSLWWDLNS
ncbi:hypothetical protein [Roseimicrobium gellanilyticum]|uniref:hypothetical protein n=1 Tax=Roseimicrobium gellanilyticum TaxID=748857 RepID=UPI000DEAAF39|nr:hypothetical protein [Roseimicrobium gellanilyticum]